MAPHLKTHPKAEIVKYKARLVAKGLTQIEGEDYLETYAPVSRQESLRALSALAALNKYHIHHLDVVAAYLHSTLEEVYMTQPPEFDDGTSRAWRVLKAVYGLKQSDRAWNNKLNLDFKAIELRQLQADCFVYTRILDSSPIYIINRVDDMSILASKRSALTRL